MAIRTLKNAGRRKAAFGTQEAAILAAAGINASTQLVAAARNASATKDAAKKQAEAQIASAKQQSQAIKEQTEKNNEFQIRSQDFIKTQNEENRDLQKDIQLQLQMLTGQQNENNRLEASKLVVRNGGKTPTRSVNPTSFLRGSNIPFHVTDGGGVMYRGSTPEGYDLYELYGDDHEHYHKAQGGKYKSGVGIKFDKSFEVDPFSTTSSKSNKDTVVEGQGNQNTKQGEYMLTTPYNAYFISKNDIEGFNPVANVKKGMHPLVAFNIQERIKQLNGISDDGKHNVKVSSPVKRMAGGTVTPESIYAQIGPAVGVDTIAPTAAGVVYKHNEFKNGGCVEKHSIRNIRQKARYGTWQPRTDYAAMMRNYKLPTPSFSNAGNGASSGGGTGSGLSWNNGMVDLVAAGIGGLSNIIGGFITDRANRKAANIISDASRQSAGIMRNAYNSMTGIDLSNIRQGDFKSAHVMPALQAPISNANATVSRIDRQLQRRLSNAGKYSGSGAAALKRMNDAEIDALDMRNAAYAEDDKQRQAIIQANMDRINAAAEKNAELDVNSNDKYAAMYLDALKYNNDINNQKILGAAGVESDAITNSANASSQAATANAIAWAQALGATGQGFAQGLTSMANREFNIQAIMLGADGDARASYYANPKLTSTNEARNEYNSLKAQYDTLSPAQKNSDYGKGILRKINIIGNSRGF